MTASLSSTRVAPLTRIVIGLLGALILQLTPLAGRNSPRYQLSLSTFDTDRAGQVVVFPLPEDLRAGAELRAADGRVLPLHLGPDETGCFTVTFQRAGEELQLYLAPSSLSTAAPSVVTTRDADELHLTVAGHTLLTYRLNKDAPTRPGIDPVFKRASYLHPIMTPAGHIVSDDSPANHPHHHGLWTAWSVTKFDGRAPNFWELGERKGTVEFAGIDRIWSGPVHGGFIARQRMIDLTAPAPIAVLNETWEVTAYRVADTPIPVGVFDLQSTEACATSDALELPTYRYGGLGFRGSGEWDGKQGSQS